MLCDKCRKNEANVHVTRVVNGVKYEQNLCSSCAAEQAGREESGFSGGFGLEQLINLFRSIGMVGVVMAPGSRCAGHMAAAPDLEQLGLSLPGSETKTEPAADIASLRAELNSAVANEKYERAAELRDEIFQLERQMNAGQA